MLSGRRRFRLYDLLDRPVGAIGLVVSLPLIAIGIAASRRSTKSSGIFRQERIGKNADPFTIYKLQTMSTHAPGSSVTVAGDPRVTRAGAWLRRLKLDELPQLFNMLRGQMTLVGPRPDVPGYADTLTGDDSIVNSVKPGISGPATILFRDEADLLGGADDPVRFNDEVLYPLKVRINRAWIEHGTIVDDARLLAMTIFPIGNTDTIEALIDKWAPCADQWPEYQQVTDLRNDMAGER